MNELRIKKAELEGFKNYLIMEERSKGTIKKYIHDIDCFLNYFGKNPVTKAQIISYKESLQKKIQCEKCEYHAGLSEQLLPMAGSSRVSRKAAEDPAAGILPGGKRIIETGVYTSGKGGQKIR